MFDRTSMRETGIAVVLALVTGYVDGVGFTHMFDVFVANQSGNVILLGIGLGDAEWDAVWRPGVSMAAFVAGVVAGLLLGRRVAAGRRASALLGLETVALVIVAAGAGDLAGRTTPFTGARGIALLGIAAFAMGIQTDVIRRAARVSVATTYSSGTLVHIGDELAGGVTRATLSPEARRALGVLGAVVTAYVAGAAFGTAVVDHWGHGLWVVAGVCGCVGLWCWWSPLRTGDPSR